MMRHHDDHATLSMPAAAATSICIRQQLLYSLLQPALTTLEFWVGMIVPQVLLLVPEHANHTHWVP